MSPDELAAARALVEAATPGPWATTEDLPRPQGLRQAGSTRSLLMVDADGMACVDSEADAAFVAAARTLVPALLDEVERLRYVLTNAGGVCTACGQHQSSAGVVHLLGRAEAAEARAATLQTVVETLATAGGAQQVLGCTWCDTWGFETKEELRGHAARCEAHPGNQRAETAEAEVERLGLPENRGIGDTEITAVLQERDALRVEVKRLRAGVKRLRACIKQVDEHLAPRTPGGET